MTAILQQASNNTGLALTREISNGVVDGTVSWTPQEPNTYKDFGGKYKMVARVPITADRQNRKGVITDLDVSGSWQEDITYAGVQNKIEGLLYADFRKKTETAVTGCETSDDAYLCASSAGWVVGDLLFASGFVNAANNSLKHVVTIATGKVEVSENLIDELTPPAGTKIVKVGHRCTTGDITYTSASKTLSSTTLDFTTLGVIVGEWLFMGSDVTAASLGANLGLARVYSLAPHVIVFDKVQAIDPTMSIVDASGAGKTVEFFFGRVAKNEQSALIKRYTYQAERTLGMDDTTATTPQAEYLTGGVINEAVFTINTADKGTCEWSLLAAGYQTRASSAGLKAGSRPSVVSGSAFNTSTDVKRLSLELVGQDAPLYAYVMDCSITINNNAKTNKAIGVIGAFSMTEGQFMVTSAVTAYFANVGAASAISNNSNVTLDICMARSNNGIIFDIPLVSLGDGLPKITANEAIQLPLTISAATARSVNPNADYTFMMVFFDYLPTIIAP